jgi:hypothetical protein
VDVVTCTVRGCQRERGGPTVRWTYKSDPATCAPRSRSAHSLGVNGQLAAPGAAASVALSRACIAACTGGASWGATSCARNDSKGAQIARDGIGYDHGLANCGIAGAEDACWIPGKPGGVCDASLSRLPGGHEWIEDANVMDNSCRCGGAATMRRMMGLTQSLGRGLTATGGGGGGGGDEDKRRQQELTKSNVASHATKR